MWELGTAGTLTYRRSLTVKSEGPVTGPLLLAETDSEWEVV